GVARARRRRTGRRDEGRRRGLRGEGARDDPRAAQAHEHGRARVAQVDHAARAGGRGAGAGGAEVREDRHRGPALRRRVLRATGAGLIRYSVGVKRLGLFALLAACGDNLAGPIDAPPTLIDAPPPDVPPGGVTGVIDGRCTGTPGKPRVLVYTYENQW